MARRLRKGAGAAPPAGPCWPAMSVTRARRRFGSRGSREPASKRSTSEAGRGGAAVSPKQGAPLRQTVQCFAAFGLLGPPLAAARRGAQPLTHHGPRRARRGAPRARRAASGARGCNGLNWRMTEHGAQASARVRRGVGARARGAGGLGNEGGGGGNARGRGARRGQRRAAGREGGVCARVRMRVFARGAWGQSCGQLRAAAASASLLSGRRARGVGGRPAAGRPAGGRRAAAGPCPGQI